MTAPRTSEMPVLRPALPTDVMRVVGQHAEPEPDCPLHDAVLAELTQRFGHPPGAHLEGDAA